MKRQAMALAAALLLALASCGQAEPAAPQTLPGAPGGLKAGQQAPDFTLELHGGGEVTLSALRGKPVVLNFYTTWCRPCQAEMPDFQAISEEYGGRISVLGISSGESRDVVDAFLARAGYSYPMAYDPGGAVSAIYGIQFIPQTWVLDADGVIVEYIPGGTDAQKLRQALDRALSPEA